MAQVRQMYFSVDKKMALTVLPRRLVIDEDWNEFVDLHPAGWWWHRAEWLNYSKAYDEKSQDESVALVDETDKIVGVCPYLIEGEAVSMGGKPCAGPIIDGDRIDYLEAVMALKEHGWFKPNGRKISWRWSFNTQAVEQFCGALQYAVEMRRSGWWTRVLDLSGDGGPDELWSGIRKSYRPLISKATKQYEIMRSDNFHAYQKCHKRAGVNRPRNFLTYSHQRRWLRDGFGAIVTAHHLWGVNASEYPKTPEAQGGVSDGASPSPSTTNWREAVDDRGRKFLSLGNVQRYMAEDSCVGSVYVINYKGRAYYASGPSLIKNIQHACQWTMIRALKAAFDSGTGTIRSYEIGWLAEPDGKGSIEFFKSGFGGAEEPVIVMSL